MMSLPRRGPCACRWLVRPSAISRSPWFRLGASASSSLLSSRETRPQFVQLSGASLQLMDRDLIATPQRSSRVELCDFYCRDGAFVHVKKNTGAVSMSHLFSQSVVASDLLVSLPA